MCELQLVIKKDQSDFESKLFFKPGESLLLLCQNAGIEIASPCGGKGICGKCEVRFLKGAPLPTATERKWISPQKLRDGYRLLCLSKLYSDCTILLPKKNEPDIVQDKFVVSWNDVSESFLPLKQMGAYFIATDIGTTTLVMQKRKLCDGSVVDTYKAVNAQKKYGADVISRMEASMHGHREELKRLIMNQLEEGLSYLDKEGVSFMVIAANTAMTHLFMGYDVTALATAPFIPKTLQEIETCLDGIRTYVMPGFSAFVGGDIYAGLLSIDHNKNYVNKKEGIYLLIDLGTNAEMVLYNRERMIATSAAAGSAFDAIADSGLYGADVIAILHQLLEQNQIDEHGTLQEPYFHDGVNVTVARHNPDKTGRMALQDCEVNITQKDIRQIQLAKAAVRCGIDYLVEKFGCRICDIDCIFLAGGFGYYLDAKKAVNVGLLPKECENKIISCGNTALAGASVYAHGKLLDDINLNYVNKCETMNLAMQEDFSQRYIAYLDF